MSKFCIKCGNQLNDNDTICNNCGTEIIQNKENIQVNQTIINSKPKTNGLAIAGFVTSLVNLLLCCGSISIISLILSIVGLVQVNKNNEGGKGLAIAGIIISAIMLVAYIALMALGFFAGFVEGFTSY